MTFAALDSESTGALALDNEYSGFAVAPAHYIAFAERKAWPKSLADILSLAKVHVTASFESALHSAYVGIDWADTKHDICLSTGWGLTIIVQFDCIPRQVGITH